MEDKNVKELIKFINDTINIIECRHQYKVRKNLHMSDKEFNELIYLFKQRMLVSNVRERLFVDIITEYEKVDQDILDGKKVSMLTQVSDAFSTMIKRIYPEPEVVEPEKESVAV